MAAGSGQKKQEDTVTEERLTPVMRQYRDLKEQHPDTILFFRIGDFYETFNDDAVTIARELEIVLTSRSKGGDNRIPLAGVPYHAAEAYIAKLVGRGFKVAVCEQVEDPKTAKGIVKRELARIITPGTVIDSSMLLTPQAAFLMAFCPGSKGENSGAAFLDVSTGEFFVSVIENEGSLATIANEIARYGPAECLVPATITDAIPEKIAALGVVVTRFRIDAFHKETATAALLAHFALPSLAGFGCDDTPAAIGAAGAALTYARETQNSALAHIRSLSVRGSSDALVLDAITLRNLEIRGSIRGRAKDPTLFSTLDRTKTPMGSRLLLSHLSRPLTAIGEINARLDAVEFFTADTARRLEVRSRLANAADIGRIAARIAYGNAGPRELLALAATLASIPLLRQALHPKGTTLPALLAGAAARISDLPDLVALIRRAIVDDPPAIARNGGIIRQGFSRELDDIHTVLHSGKDWIARLQEEERERTGIKSLKIGYNRIFGYYIDVTKPNLALVPAHYVRKQTTATGERYTLPELREKEDLITNADERVLKLERELYEGLLATLKEHVEELQKTADGIAAIDVAAALAEVACTGNYVRPQVNDSDELVIRDGRHPVVEAGMPGGFVPNDVELAGSGTQILIITGANMAGKSTYMRAAALICIMAQAGSFVPARYAGIGVLDRVFTRVGAFDDLASGQSTFFVEMLELANILNNVTGKSLVILDEIGRGTSTIDGCSIARAVLEYLHGKGAGGPKTLFATHFHELITAEESLKRVKNVHFAVRETDNEVTFLRKLIPGATDKSYGIHVARLAGIPRKVTDRAEKILAEEGGRGIAGSTKPQRYTQILLVDDQKADQPVDHPVLRTLASLEPDSMTPLAALNALASLKEILDGSDRP